MKLLYCGYSFLMGQQKRQSLIAQRKVGSCWIF